MLWHDGRGDWEGAHRVAQEIDTAEGAWIHAYLHRKEGDAGNAAYWYRGAAKPVASVPLEIIGASVLKIDDAVWVWRDAPKWVGTSHLRSCYKPW